MSKGQSKIQFLGGLRRLNLKPGDRFVMMCDHDLSPKNIVHIKAAWAELTGSDTKLLVLGKGMKVGVINDGGVG